MTNETTLQKLRNLETLYTEVYKLSKLKGTLLTNQNLQMKIKFESDSLLIGCNILSFFTKEHFIELLQKEVLEKVRQIVAIENELHHSTKF